MVSAEQQNHHGSCHEGQHGIPRTGPEAASNMAYLLDTPCIHVCEAHYDMNGYQRDAALV